MKKLWDFINGKKSYLFIAGGSIAYAAFMLEAIDEETFKWLAGICAAGYAASMRSAVKKAETAALDVGV